MNFFATFEPAGTSPIEKVPLRTIAIAVCIIEGLLKQGIQTGEMEGQLAV